jgi:anti-sigma B factor antagonist
MPVTLEQGGPLCFLRLEGEISVGSAAELKVALLQALASETDVRLDLERATELDVTALQLLWAAERGLRAHTVGPSGCLAGGGRSRV